MEGDGVEYAAKWAGAATVIGGLVPFLWIAISLLAFNTRESPATDLYWDVVYITCPPWLWLAASPSWMALLNGLLYGSIATVVAIMVTKRKKTR
jgi:hypothetical protein